MSTGACRASLLSGIFRGTFVLFLIVFFTCSIGALAQLSTTATITGTVTDSTGALVAAATVTITNDATNVSLKTQSNGRGVFVAPGLNVATYSVTIAKKGFKNYTVTGIELHPTETIQVNGSLAVGAASETVTVGATSTDVELSSPQLSNYISTEQVSSLPMNGRNFEGVAALAPGVVNQSQGSAIGTGGRNTSSVLVINGMSVSRTFYTLDGVWNENTGNMTANSITPNPDSLEEVRVLQNDFSAQYSLLGSSVIVEQTKSGTSNFHGTLWEYVRNDDLNTKNYFTITPPLITPYKQNIFGFNVGGPVFIPHHYNTNRQKTFFFWDESYVILHVPSVPLNYSWIPTPLQISGCFASPIVNASGALYPAGTGACPSTSYQISGINASSEAYLKALYPAPNYSSTANTNNYVDLQPLTTYQRDDEFKIDHFFNPKYHLLAEYLQEYQKYSQNNESPGTTPISYETDYTHNKIAQLALTQTLSPNMVNTTSVAMNIYLLDLELEGISDISQLVSSGFSENLFYNTAVYASRTPVVSFASGAAGQGIQASRPIPHASDLDNTITDNWSWLKGKNYFTAGITFVFNTKRQVSGQQTNGNFGFTDTYTAASTAQKTAANACGTSSSSYNTAAQCNEDYSIADMELGNLSSFSEASNAPHGDMHAFSWSPYAEDQFKFNKNLTLTLGLRIYHLPLPYGVPGSETNFVPSAYNPALAPTVNEATGVTNIPPNVPGYANGLLYNNGQPGGLPRNFSNNHVWYAAPDAGFAWDVFGDGRTSLRGGFGMSYTRIFTNQDCSFNCIANPPVFTSQNLTNLNFFNQPTTWNIVTAATGTGVTAKPVSVESVTMADANIQASPVASWSLGVQHEFPANITASIVGAGSRIQHQEANPNINVPPYYVSGGVQYDFNPLINSNPANSKNAGDNQYYYAPYQGYGSITDYMTELWQEWNGLEAQIKHQVTKSLFITAAYTWSHSTSNSTIDVHNFNRYHGNTVGLNYPDSMNISLLYQLPFFQHSGNMLEKQALSGWSINDITTFRSGDSLDPGLSGIGFQGNASRPDVVPGVSTNGPKAWKTTTGVTQEWFNTSAFSCPGSTGANVGTNCGTMSAANGNFGLYGNAMTGIIRGPGQEIYNMALFKEFHITEANYFEFRAEAFNTFNHTNPNNPNTTLGNSNFGKVTTAADPRIIELALRYRF